MIFVSFRWFCWFFLLFCIQASLIDLKDIGILTVGWDVIFIPLLIFILSVVVSFIIKIVKSKNKDGENKS